MMQLWQLIWRARDQNYLLRSTSKTIASHPGTSSSISVERILRVSCAERRCVQCKRRSGDFSANQKFCVFILPRLLLRSCLIFGLQLLLFFEKRGIAHVTI